MLRTLRLRPVAVVLVLAGSLLWAYWPTLRDMAGKWLANPQYAHGYLVPGFALFLLWLRRKELTEVQPGPSWWGTVPLFAGLAVRLAGTLFYIDWLEGISLLPVLTGMVLLVGGRAALRCSWLAIGFLVFMIPLPHRLETGLSQPLQEVATQASTYLLQTLGRPAFAEGNVIVVGDTRVGVVEACNGLGMLLLFFALATGVALLIRRPTLDRALIIASAIPIAVAANVIRITVTSILSEVAGQRWTDLVFHDLAGWLMMPLALALLGVELWVLSRLLVDLPPDRLLPLRVGRTATAPGRRQKAEGRRQDVAAQCPMPNA